MFTSARELFTRPTDQLGRWTRFVVFQLRLWRHCGRLLKQNRMGTQAAALSYHTIFGIVPLAIVMLMVFQSFPAYRQIGLKMRDFLYETAHLDQIEYPVESPDDGSTETVRLTDHIDQLTERYIERLDTGTITLVSGAFVVWAALGLLGTIERSFNQIWHVPRSRSFVHRIVNYWALLTLGPLLLGLGFWASTHYMAQTHLQEGLTRYGRMLLPYVISTVGLFFLYFVMPNTRVSVRSALWGAAVAALIWSGAKALFGIYLTRFIPYRAIYGVMGLVPLAVMWIFITWLIVLFGLQLTYATQHLKTLDAAELARMKKKTDVPLFLADETTLIRVVMYIVEQFQARRGPVSAAAVATHFEMPADFTEKILDHLVARSLLFETAEPRVGYAPTTEGRNIRLSDVTDAIAEAAFGQTGHDADPLEPVLRARRQLLAGHTIDEFVRPEPQEFSAGVQEEQDGDPPPSDPTARNTR